MWGGLVVSAYVVSSFSSVSMRDFLVGGASGCCGSRDSLRRWRLSVRLSLYCELSGEGGRVASALVVLSSGSLGTLTQFLCWWYARLLVL